MVLVAGIIGASTLAIVVVSTTQVSAEHLDTVRKSIEQGIISKGKVLTENQAIALRGLALDNAFLDMQRLVEHAISGDPDLVYGIYLNADHHTLAYSRQGAQKAEALPAREAWRELGIPAAELTVASSKVQSVRRLGQELLEVTLPVFDEGHELIGSVRYGLSTRQMQDAIAAAKADSSRRLVRTVGLIGSLVALTLLIGIGVSRAQAVRITRPITALTAAARELASNNRAVRVQIESGDELELLGAAFNRMVEDLDASYRSLEEMNHTLEQKVAQRTVELADKNRDMRLIFDNVDQGFVSLSPQGTMAAEHSRVVDTWFGAAGAGMPFWTYMHATSPAFADQFEFGWEQLTAGVLPMALCLDQLPKRLAVGDRVWSLRYLPFYHATELAGLLVVIAEITERLAREREEAEQAELTQAFKRAMHDRAGFASFLREAVPMVDDICTRRLEADPIQLKRVLHTLKGNAACQGLAVVAGICHDMESELGRAPQLSDTTLAKLSKRWATLLEQLESSARSPGESTMELARTDYAALVARLSSDPIDRSALLEQVLAWQLEPVERSFEPLAEYARDLARRLGKGDIDVAIEGNGVRILRDAWAPFFNGLVHVVRNAVDHGLEPPERRETTHKPRSGTLTLTAHCFANVLSFEVRDDGAGIDWQRVADAARQRQLPHDTPADLLNALCTDGISTRSDVTTTSGRGVGMAAVKQWVTERSGHIEVRTQPGAGTTWVIQFPWSASDRSPDELRRVVTVAA